jgi:hypothetical protein
MDNKDDQVGYGSPPKATRFEKGRSGNAKGRPKGSRNLHPLIERELNTRIPITENGRARRITKREAFAKQLVNKSIAGDLRSAIVLLKTMMEMEARTVPGVAAKREHSEVDQKILEAMHNRFVKYKEAEDEPSSA